PTGRPESGHARERSEKQKAGKNRLFVAAVQDSLVKMRGPRDLSHFTNNINSDVNNNVSVQVNLYRIFANRLQRTVGQAHLTFLNAFEAGVDQRCRDIHIGDGTKQTTVYAGLLGDLQ